MLNEYTLTKMIGKQGRQSIMVIPALLKEWLKSKNLVDVRNKVLEGFAL